jgi:hypothetical protein
LIPMPIDAAALTADTARVAAGIAAAAMHIVLLSLNKVYSEAQPGPNGGP